MNLAYVRKLLSAFFDDFDSEPSTLITLLESLANDVARSLRFPPITTVVAEKLQSRISNDVASPSAFPPGPTFPVITDEAKRHVAHSLLSQSGHAQFIRPQPLAISDAADADKGHAYI
jgi:hypothetical protein